LQCGPWGGGRCGSAQIPASRRPWSAGHGRGTACRSLGLGFRARKVLDYCWRGGSTAVRWAGRWSKRSGEWAVRVGRYAGRGSRVRAREGVGSLARCRQRAEQGLRPWPLNGDRRRTRGTTTRMRAVGPAFIGDVLHAAKPPGARAWRVQAYRQTVGCRRDRTRRIERGARHATAQTPKRLGLGAASGKGPWEGVRLASGRRALGRGPAVQHARRAHGRARRSGRRDVVARPCPSST
jgi:hypothetical protein